MRKSSDRPTTASSKRTGGNGPRSSSDDAARPTGASRGAEVSAAARKQLADIDARRPTGLKERVLLWGGRRLTALALAIGDYAERKQAARDAKDAARMSGSGKTR